MYPDALIMAKKLTTQEVAREVDIQSKMGVEGVEDTQTKLMAVQEQAAPPMEPMVLPLVAPLVEPLKRVGIVSPAAIDSLPHSSHEHIQPVSTVLVEAVHVAVEETFVTPMSAEAPLEAEKPPPFVEPDIEMEEGELEDEMGYEQQTMLAQDKIQILTKDVSIPTLEFLPLTYCFANPSCVSSNVGACCIN